MSLHQMRRNDTRPHFQVQIQINGEGVDLTGSTVRFHMMDSAGQLVVNAPAVILQDPLLEETFGIVEYRWVAADTANSGSFPALWEVTFPDGSVQTFPTTVPDEVIIRDDIA
jgi:hypothetical protein